MLDWMLIIMIIFGIITILLTYEKKDIIMAILSSIIWLITAVGSLEIEIPYQLYNGSSKAIETGVQTIQYHPLSYLFMAIGIIMFISFIFLIFDTFKRR